MLFVMCLSLSSFSNLAFASVLEGFSEIVKKTLPAVVSIRVLKEQDLGDSRSGLMNNLPPNHPLRDLFRRFEIPDGSEEPRVRRGFADGSGFLIRSDGVVVTNHHVIEGAKEITVTMQGGKTYKASLVGADPQTDLAVIQLKGVEEVLPYLTFGDSDQAEVGNWTIAIGNPLGQLGGSVTAGIISARNRDIRSGIYDDYIQTDTSINQGNSGGPLLNVAGQVIGVNTVIFSTGGGSIGLSFSIPSNLVKLVVDQLVETGSTQRGWLGVEIQNVTPDVAEALGYKDRKGALIVKVRPNTPAERAGLQDYDILTSFDGKEVPSARRLPLIVGLSQVGSIAEMEVWREGRVIRLAARVGERDNSSLAQSEDEKQPRNEATPNQNFGFGVGELNNEFRERLNLDSAIQGIVVVEVAPDSPAENAGLAIGDIITELDRTPIRSVPQAEQLMKNFQRQNKEVLIMKIRKRNGESAIVGLRIGS